MPNWCDNRLVVEDQTKDFQEFVKDGLSLEKISPTPKEMLDPVLEKAGLPDWYAWRAKNWGTKWDLEAGEKFKGDILYFSTAWSPPIEAISTLSKRFPTMTFTLDYHESGMGFAGHTAFKSGGVSDLCTQDPQEVKEIGRDVFGFENEGEEDDE